jgi:hypothetical protein
LTWRDDNRNLPAWCVRVIQKAADVIGGERADNIGGFISARSAAGLSSVIGEVLQNANAQQMGGFLQGQFSRQIFG